MCPRQVADFPTHGIFGAALSLRKSRIDPRDGVARCQPPGRVGVSQRACLPWMAGWPMMDSMITDHGLSIVVARDMM